MLDTKKIELFCFYVQRKEPLIVDMLTYLYYIDSATMVPYNAPCCRGSHLLDVHHTISPNFSKCLGTVPQIRPDKKKNEQVTATSSGRGQVRSGKER